MTTTDTIRLDALVRASAHRFPDRPALRDGGRSWTYAELDRVIDELADGLGQLGVRPGDRVGVHAPKSAETIMALYGALRAGAVVAPLDTGDPAVRTARMVHNAGMSWLLTTDRAHDVCRAAAEQVLGEAPEEGMLKHGVHWVRTATTPGEPLPAPTDSGGYVLFTSGSTGWPKGVLLSHTNVGHYARWAAEECGLRETDRIGSQAALTFDLTTFDLFSAASVGACTVLMPDVLRFFPRDVVRWLADEEITAFVAVPSLYQNMLEQGGIASAPPPSLRVGLFGGEAFAPRALQRYLELLGDIPFYNLYGPTETNACTYFRMPKDWTADEELTIGRAIGGVTIDIIDAEGNPTDGEGEIHVAGPTVCQGYLENGVLRPVTESVAFRDGRTHEAYPTGDLGRMTEDGRIFLRGRRDHQVKRRGHRIHLLDVENAVLELPQVAGAVVVAKTEPHDGEIWAYALTDAEPAALLSALRDTLPQRMLPDRIVPMSALPTTTSGKVDRRALSAAPEPAAHTITEEISA